MERRFTTNETQPVGVTTRDDGGATITGYAAVFYRDGDAGTEFQILTDLVERIDRDAFTRSIDEGDDVRALFNHDTSQILGRTESGTLKLSADDIGLRYSIDAPTTPAAQHVISAIERGDLTGSSFAFRTEREEFVEGDSGAPDVRNIKSVRMFDVGPVTFPAYTGTTTDVRSYTDAGGNADGILGMYQQWKSQCRRAPRATAARARIRARG